MIQGSETWLGDLSAAFVGQRSNIEPLSPVWPAYLPSQIVPDLFSTGTPTALPYSVHEPS
jgi:hypothetical protein